jgi:predicted amidohydrolase YtcJ
MNWNRIAIALAALILGVSKTHADGLIDNVNGITLDANGKPVRFHALTITADGKIGAVLARGEKPPTPLDWRFDGKGQTLLPGLIDAHGHVISLGNAKLTLDLSEATSLEDAKTRIAAYAARHPERKWILGAGWNQESWGLGRFPTAADLASLGGGRPIYLRRVDGHAGWANDAAMKAAGITAATRAPQGGRIDKGLFVDAAETLIERAIPALSNKDRDLAFLTAQETLLALGVTAIADMGTSVDDWNAFRRAGDTGRLRMRIFSYAGGLEPMQALTAGEPTPWLYDDRLRLAGVKLYNDGALGSRGACLKAPYADAPVQSGLCFNTNAKIQNLMSRAAMDGFQLAVHAIGDKANAQLLSAIEELAQTYRGDRRWRVEHAQVVDPVDLARFGRLGIIASMQPVHQTSDRTMAEARLGPNRLKGAYAWNAMVKIGSRLAFGSDTPVESANPFPGLAAAITREGTDGQPIGGWQPQERVTREQALAGFTTGAAYASFAEDKIGRIATGYRADFVLTDTDPLIATPEALRTTKVIETWVGGQRVFTRSSAR